MKNQYLFWILFILSCFSCSKDKDNILIDDTTEIVELKENARVIDKETLNLLEEISELHLRFSSENTLLRQIKDGDVIISGEITNQVPSGFLRRVLKVKKDTDALILETEPASLFDIFEKLKFNRQYTLFQENFGIYETLFDRNPSIPNDEIVISGALNIIAELEEISICIENDRLITAEIRPKLSLDNSFIKCDIGLVNETLDTGDKLITKKKFKKRIFYVQAGALRIPIVITPELELFSGIKTEIVANVSFGGKLTGNYTVPIQYYDNSWHKPKEINNLELESSFDFEASATIEPYLKPNLKFYLYEDVPIVNKLLETNFYSKFYLRGEADISKSPPCKLTFGAKVGASVKVKGLDDIYNDDCIFDFAKLLYQCEEDGEFVIYDNSLKDHEIISDIAISADGNDVWAIGGCSLYKWNQGEDKFDSYEFCSIFLEQHGYNGIANSIAIHPITKKIYLSVSFGTSNKGIYRKDEENYTLITDEASSSLFSEMNFDSKGNLWFFDPFYDALSTSLFKLDNENNLTKSYSINSSLGCSRCLSNSVFDGNIIFVTENTIIMSTDEGDLKVLLESDENITPPIARDINGNILTGGVVSFSDISTFFHYNFENNTFNQYDAPKNARQIIDFASTILGETWLIHDNLNTMSASNEPEFLKWENEGDFTPLNSSNSNLPNPVRESGAARVFTDIEYNKSKDYIWLGYGDYILRYNLQK